MRTVTKNIMVIMNVYSFDELSEEVQNKVLRDVINYILDTREYENYPNMVKAIDKAEDMQTPWFVGEYLWEYAKNDIMSFINQDEYLEDGSIFSE